MTPEVKLAELQANRLRVEAEMQAKGYVRNERGFWMMPPGVGLAPADAIYREQTGNRTLD